MNTKIYSLILIIFLGNILVSVLIFTNGFLIRRISLNDTNSKSYPSLKKFNKSVILFIDALRFDFIFNNDNNKYFGLPSIQRMIKNEPSKAKLFKFIADPPTTTMQRIKALMTGTLPTFIDAGANFGSYYVEDDNFIRQSYLNNKSVVVLGDDTWMSLFESHLITQQHTYPSFNIKDLDTNDINVNEKLRQILGKKTHNWDIIISHFLGIDHCGHSFGPKSPVIRRKLNEIDDTIRYVAESISDDTLLIVIGDHGMTETGDHGGDSRPELETALFFYSKKDLFKKDINTNKFRIVEQINLTPTLAQILGLPIPFSNLGIVIDEIFENYDELESAKANYLQIIRFIEKYKMSEVLIEDLEKEDLIKSENLTQFRAHMQMIQNKCREKWSSFNIEFCIIGLICLLFSTFSLFVLSKIIGDSKIDINNIIKTNFIFYYIFSIVFLAFVAVLISKPYYFANVWLLILIFNLSFLWKTKSYVIQFLNSFNRFSFKPEYLILFLVYLIPFSNSYIIKENNSFRFLLISYFYIQIYYCLRQKDKKILQFLIFLFILRISEIFYICREEALGYCQETVFSKQIQKNSLSKNYYYLILSFNFFSALLIFYQMKLKIFFLNFLSALNFISLIIYNLIQIEINEMESNLDQKIDLENLKSFNFYLARFIYISFLSSQFLIWTNLIPNFLKQKLDRSEKILYFIQSFTILLSLITAESFLSLWFLNYILYTYLIKDSNYKNYSNLMNPIVALFLLEHYYFYASGHETIFTHIKWESAFHGFQGDNNSLIKKALMGMLIVFNTFSSVAISSIYAVFLALENISIKKNKIPTNQINLECIIKLFLFNSIKILSTALSAYILRRHLMVWKIFAPRFAFDAIGFVVGTVLCIILFTLFSSKRNKLDK